jgi:hypothetical protein
VASGTGTVAIGGAGFVFTTSPTLGTGAGAGADAGVVGFATEVCTDTVAGKVSFGMGIEDNGFEGAVIVIGFAKAAGAIGRVGLPLSITKHSNPASWDSRKRECSSNLSLILIKCSTFPLEQ